MATFTASGDSLILDRMVKRYDGFDEVADFIKSADAAVTNLETVITDDTCFGNQYSGGAHLSSPEGVLDDLTDYGFNMFGCANNHAMDYSYNGLANTIKCLDKRGLAHAGVGMDMDAASRPAFVNSRNGRIALISVSDLIPKFLPSRAGEYHDGYVGRPGLNTLRYTMEFNVEKSYMDALRNIASVTGINERVEVSRKQGFAPTPPADVFDFGGIIFREVNDPDKMGRRTYPFEKDVQRVERSIKSALIVADYVIVTFHSHLLKGGDERTADYFLETFARRCIDAGACGVVGGGTHLLKGIEIYKNRPIFYSLGNFIFTLDRIYRQPDGLYEESGLSMDLNGAEAIYKRSHKNGRGLETQSVYYRSVLPCWNIENGELKHVKLLPIELSFDAPNMSLRGFPRKAEPLLILDELQSASNCYGTKLSAKNGMIEVDITENR